MNYRPIFVFVLSLLIAVTFSGCKTAENPIRDSDVRIASYEEESRIYFSLNVDETLSSLYDAMGKEFPFCLHGHKIENGYRVNDIRVPWVRENNESGATFRNGNCTAEDDFLGMIHNHSLSGQCIPSQLDIDRFMNSEHALIEVISCQRIRETGTQTEYFGVIIDEELQEFSQEHVN